MNRRDRASARTAIWTASALKFLFDTNKTDWSVAQKKGRI
jgi:hypothetical protein